MHATPRTAIIGAGTSGLTTAKSSCTVRLPWIRANYVRPHLNSTLGETSCSFPHTPQSP